MTIVRGINLFRPDYFNSYISRLKVMFQQVYDHMGPSVFCPFSLSATLSEHRQGQYADESVGKICGDGS